MQTPQEETLHMSGNTNATSSMHVKTRHCVKVDVEIEARTQNVAMERKDVAGNAAPCAITGGEYKACEDHALKLVHPADSHGLGQPYVQESQITRLANATDYVTPHTTTGGNGKPIGHASSKMLQKMSRHAPSLVMKIRPVEATSRRPTVNKRGGRRSW
eukprot:scaffold264255_cov26-Tisochrysis_lutea.AAC.1